MAPVKSMRPGRFSTARSCQICPPITLPCPYGLPIHPRMRRPTLSGGARLQGHPPRPLPRLHAPHPNQIAQPTPTPWQPSYWRLYASVQQNPLTPALTMSAHALGPSAPLWRQRPSPHDPPAGTTILQHSEKRDHAAQQRPLRSVRTLNSHQALYAHPSCSSLNTYSQSPDTSTTHRQHS